MIGFDQPCLIEYCREPIQYKVSWWGVVDSSFPPLSVSSHLPILHLKRARNHLASLIIVRTSALCGSTILSSSLSTCFAVLLTVVRENEKGNWWDIERRPPDWTCPRDSHKRHFVCVIIKNRGEDPIGAIYF
jgi:hypothetical protein